jgi:predicted SprT family Zn-dependent metalloprotease
MTTVVHRTTQNGDGGITAAAYTSLQSAWDHFNATLWSGQLRDCLITLQRHKGAYGYFHGKRFRSLTIAGEERDEIALNPAGFLGRSSEDILSTLVHEMAHAWQQQHGTPSRGGYHNAQWAAEMRRIGLRPVSIGKPGGGNGTGRRGTHEIEPEGMFRRACRELLADRRPLLYHDQMESAEAKKKKASKTKYTCPKCGANAWAKPQTKLTCGEVECNLAAMEPENQDDDDEA